MTTIENEFRHLNRGRGGTLILDPADALAFVRRCQEKQVKVLGVDGFHLTADTTRPDMGESIDLSQPSYRGEDCWRLAEDFIAQRQNSGLHFEVVASE